MIVQERFEAILDSLHTIDHGDVFQWSSIDVCLLLLEHDHFICILLFVIMIFKNRSKSDIFNLFGCFR